MSEPEDPAPLPPAVPAAIGGSDAQSRNEALRHLFMTDPHFRTSDGLDVAVDEAFEIASSPRARQRKIELARAMGMLDDELVEQERPEPEQGEAGGA
jgi:hypothetical protein